MNVTLPRAWKEFVDHQIKSGEFDSPSEVVREGLRLLRDEQETKAMAEMQEAFAAVDQHSRKGEPTPKDRALINAVIARHRQKRNVR